MRFDKKDKFNPLYIDPFEIINCVGPVAYRLGLSPSLLGLHIMFHVSMLKKYHGNGDYIIKYGSLLLDKNLQYEEEPVRILYQYIWKMRTKEINIKIQRKHHLIKEAIWKIKEDMRDNTLIYSPIRVLLYSYLSLSFSIWSLGDEWWINWYVL